MFYFHKKNLRGLFYVFGLFEIKSEFLNIKYYLKYLNELLIINLKKMQLIMLYADLQINSHYLQHNSLKFFKSAAW